MKFIPGNAQHIGTREQQQDSMGFSNPTDTAFVAHGGFLGVLADGMGGMAGGSLASRAAVSNFLSSYMAKPETEPIPDALLRALRQANESVLALATERGLKEEMGTTLVAAVAGEKSLYWISAGDSRAYLIRQEHLTQLTIDHVFANELERDVVNGRLSKTDALAHPERDDLTSYLGKTDLSEIDRNIKQFPLEAGDRVILCSDGAYKNLSDSELAMAGMGDPQQACENLISSVLQKHAPRQDNVTVLAIDCQPAPGRLWDRAAGLVWRKAPLAAVALLVIAAASAAVWQWTSQPGSGGASTQANRSRGQEQTPRSKADQTGSAAAGDAQDADANRQRKHNKNSNRNENAGAGASEGGDPKQSQDKVQDQVQDEQPQGGHPQNNQPQGKQSKQEGPQTAPATEGVAPQGSPAPAGSPERQPDQKPTVKGGNPGDSLKKMLEKGIDRVTGRQSA
jgi:protein phosphatase